MNPFRLSLLISLVVSTASAGAASLTIARSAIAQTPVPSVVPATSNPAPTTTAMPVASRLSLEKLVQALDQNDVSGAIQQVELGWKYQFEQYYGGKFALQYLEPDQIVQSLDRLHRSTGKKTALI